MTDSLLLPGSDLKLTPAQRKDLAEELDAILTEHETDTIEYRRQLIIQRRLYELRPRRKTWPWPGASNQILPIIRTITDQYIARVQQAMRQTHDLWYGEPLGGVEADVEGGRDWKQIATDAAIVLNGLSRDPSHLDLMGDFMQDSTDFLVKDGTVAIKIHYVSRSEPRTIVVDDVPTVIDEPLEARVVWDPIEISRCVWEVGSRDPMDSTVFGHWTEMTRAKLRRFAIEFNVPAAVLKPILAAPDEPYIVEEERILNEEMGIRQDNVSVTRTLGVFRIHELSIKWALKPDGPPAVLTVWWHHRSRTILKVFDPRGYAKPWEVARFIRRGKQMLGGSIPEALRVLNLGANILANQTTDAQTIANAFGFAYRGDGKLAAAIATSGVFPGVKLPTDDDPKKELFPFSLGTGTVGTSLNLINFYLGMAEALGRVGPSQLGQVSSGSRTAASVGLGIMQEGAQMIDAAVSRYRDVLIRCGIRTLYLYAAHDPAVFDDLLPPERASALLEVLRDPAAVFHRRVQVSLNISSAAASKEKDKQDLVVLINLLMGVYEKVLETAIPFTNPQIPIEWKTIAREVYRGLSEAVTRLISAFDQFKDPGVALPPEIADALDSILATQTAMATALPRIEGGVAPGGEPGAEAGAAGKSVV